MNHVLSLRLPSKDVGLVAATKPVGKVCADRKDLNRQHPWLHTTSMDLSLYDGLEQRPSVSVVNEVLASVLSRSISISRGPTVIEETD